MKKDIYILTAMISERGLVDESVLAVGYDLSPIKVTWLRAVVACLKARPYLEFSLDFFDKVGHYEFETDDPNGEHIYKYTITRMSPAAACPKAASTYDALVKSLLVKDSESIQELAKELSEVS